MASAPATRLAIGRVISRTIVLFRQRLWLFLGLGLFLYALPTLLLEAALGFPAATDTSNDDNIAVILATVAVAVIGSVILYAALYVAAIRTDAGEHVSWQDTLKAALPLAIPVLFVGVLQSLAFVIGAIFLLVPGIILLLMFAVAGPALVAERLGVIDSMKRSRALTKGARWRIFLLFLIYGIVVVVLITPLFAVMILAPNSGLLASIVSAGVNTMAALFPLLFAALYLELRNWKEGMAPEQLAEVFA